MSFDAFSSFSALKSVDMLPGTPSRTRRGEPQSATTTNQESLGKFSASRGSKVVFFGDSNDKATLRVTRLFAQKGVVVAASFDKDAIVVFGSLPLMLIFVVNVFATMLILFRHPWATRNVVFARSDARVGSRRRFGAPHLRGGRQIVVVVLLA